MSDPMISINRKKWAAFGSLNAVRDGVSFRIPDALRNIRNNAILVVVLIICSIYSNAQTIVTIAGGGSSISDGVPATTANLGFTGLGSFDAVGNYYFGQGFNKIKMIDPAGLIYTVAGTNTTGFSGDNGPATAAKLNFQGLAVDAVGNIYIGDYYNNRIRKVDVSTRTIHTIAGDGTPAFGGDGGPASAAKVMPSGLCLDPSGNIYFIDGGGYRVRKINTGGIISTIAGTGTGGSTGDGGPATAADLAMNGSLCMDRYGNLYLACAYTIRKINMATGIISTYAGNGGSAYIGDGMSATAAQFESFEVGMDTANGDLYIADIGNDRVHRIDASGIFHAVAGTGVGGYNGDNILATNAQLYNPEGVAVDACGNLYIADDANNRIRKVIFNTTGTPSVSITTTPNDTVCAGTAVTFSAAVTGSSTFAYQWYKNGTVVAGATSSSYAYTPANGDSVRCLFTGTDLCGGNPHTVSSNTINMAVNSITEPTISLSGVGGASMGALVTVTATVTGAGSTYNIKWYNGSTQFATTTAPTISVSYAKGAGTDNITARVVPTPAFAIPGCYDSAMSAVHTVSVSVNVVTSVVSEEEPAIWPNPAGNKLHIYLGTASNGNEQAYRIMNVLGMVVLQGYLHEGDNSVPVAELPAGVYMVVVRQAHDEAAGDSGVRVVKRIVKL